MLKDKLIAALKNKQTLNLATYGFGQVFNLITPLLVIPYIISVCGVANYGKISIGMAISFFLMVFIDYGSDIIGVKETAVNRENQDALEKIFVTTFASKLVLLTIVALIASVIFVFVPFFSGDKALFFWCLPILVGQFLNPTWFLQGQENFKWITVLTIGSKLIYLFGIFICIRTSSDYVYVNLWWGLGTILANGFTVAVIVRTRSFSFFSTSRGEITQLLRRNFAMFSSQIFVSLQMYAPIVLIGFFGNNLMAGQYKIIEQIIGIFKTYIYLFFNFVYPRVCYLIGLDLNEAFRFWKIYNGLNFVFVFLSMAVICFLAPQTVSFFSKTSVDEISHLLQFALLIPVLLSLSIPLKQLLLGFDRQKRYIQFTMLMVLASMLTMVGLIPGYGIFGVLLTLALAEVITIIIYYWSLRDKLAV